MRVESSITSISWIPSEAVKGITKLPFELGAAHYDQPPPDQLDGPGAIEVLRAEGRFRFANQLRAWVDVDGDGRIVDYGQAGGGVISSTTVTVGRSVTRMVKKGRTLVEEGEEGEELFLLLDGVLAVEVGGETVAELGPGAVLGERAILESGRRTATLRALTPCNVAVAREAELDPKVLRELREGHRREEQAR